MVQVTDLDDSELLWGARDIGSAIQRTPRQTYYILESGLLPGARKLGGRWCFRPDVFRKSMENAA